MFGKPEWFRLKRIGCGLTPIAWQGWVYSLLWLGFITAPFLTLTFVMERLPEALVWGLFSFIAVIWDMREVRRAIRRKEDENLFFIGDEEAKTELETQNYNLHLRD